VFVWVLLEQTTFGRRLYAIGGNREAARLSGVRIRSIRLAAFAFTGVGAAIAGSCTQAASPRPIRRRAAG
jgi:ribose transport system permease protein